MAISYVASSNASYSTTTATKSILVPATVAAGDLLLLGFCGGTGGSASAPPSGWTSVRAASDSVEGEVFYRIAQAGDAGATITVAQSTATRAALTMLALRGVNQASPIHTSASAVEGATAVTTHAGATVVTTDTTWIARFLMMKDGSVNATTITPPSGFTLRQSAFSGGSFQSSMGMADSAADVASGTWSGTWTVDQSTNTAVMIGVAVNPASSSVTVRPVQDITTTGLTFVGTTSGWSATADDDPATYVEFPVGSFTYEAKLATLASAPNTVTIKGFAAGSPTTLSYATSLYQGATQIATWAPETAVVTTETTKTYTLTSGQKAAITNLADLRVRVVVTVS